MANSAIVPLVVSRPIASGNKDRISALDEATWTLIWRQGLPQGTVSSSPAVANGVVYVGSHAGSIWAFDAATGARLWHSPRVDADFRGSPVIVDGLVFGSTDDGTLRAFGLP
jgi:eukaryotic-like serine/threonine-protein kinase